MRRADRRPKLPEVRARFMELLDEEGRPKWLHAHDQIYRPGENWNPRTRPSQCAGPRETGNLCGRHNFCAWCHERRAHANALKATIVHVGQSNIHRISIPLDKWGGAHPKHAHDALRRIAGVLRRHNFDHLSLWLHPFRDNPFGGIRAHIEGIASGHDADPDILDPQQPGGVGLILKRFAGEEHGAQPAEVHVERLHPHSRKHVHELVRHGLEAGRPSFPVRRIHAGLYEDYQDRLRCRLTDVHGKSRPTHVHDLPSPSPDHLTDATGDDLLTMAVMAESWRESVGRSLMTRNIRLEQQYLDLVIGATPWRADWRLPSDEDLREAHLVHRVTCTA